MDFILSQLAGFGTAFVGLVVDPLTYLYLIASVFLGITFGALPGLTATLAVTILTGFFGNKIPAGLFAHRVARRLCWRDLRRLLPLNSIEYTGHGSQRGHGHGWLPSSQSRSRGRSTRADHDS